MISKDGTHSRFQNVVSKFTLHTVQKPQHQKQASFHDESLKSRQNTSLHNVCPFTNFVLHSQKVVLGWTTTTFDLQNVFIKKKQ
jgi:hypothetical protein